MAIKNESANQYTEFESAFFNLLKKALKHFCRFVCYCASGSITEIIDVIGKIVVTLVASVAGCALAVYFYAHHNWHPLPAGTAIDRVVVEKAARKLSIFRDGRRLKSYRVALGRSPIGPKEKEGDMKTPEGIYKIDSRNAQSSFHLALH